MPDGAVCGVDIGTTHIKAVLVSPEGTLLGVAREATPVTSDGHGACHDPEEIWAAAEAVMRSAQAAAPGRPPIAAIGVTSVGEEGVPIDAGGNVLYPAIAWHERRTSPAVSSWTRRHPPEELFAVTGLRPELWFTVYKWLWMKDFQPEVWRSCRTWLGLADYVTWRWSGSAGMSLGHASRTGVLDLTTLRWHEPWAAETLACGVAALPPILPAGSPVGALGPGVIDGLVTGGTVPVVATGHDHVIGGYAAGITRPGQLLDSMGTAEALVEPVTEFASYYGSSADFGPGIVPGTRIAVTGLESGSGITAMRQALSGTGLEDAAARLEPGADGLRYVPPRPECGTGTFYGHKPSHGAAHFYRAVIEGWSLAAETAVAALGPRDRITDITCIGGGASELWTSIKASVAGRGLRCVTTPEMTGVGAALLAGGITPPSPAARTVSPVDEWVPAYQELLEEYRSLSCTAATDEHRRSGSGRP